MFYLWATSLPNNLKFIIMFHEIFLNDFMRRNAGHTNSGHICASFCIVSSPSNCSLWKKKKTTFILIKTLWGTSYFWLHFTDAKQKSGGGMSSSDSEWVKEGTWFEGSQSGSIWIIEAVKPCKTQIMDNLCIVS